MILALRALGLGDLLTAVPAIRALARAGPLALAVPLSLRPLVRWAGLADRVLPVASAVAAPPGPIAAPDWPVSLAVNLHGQGPQSTEVLRALQPGALWSYRIPGAPAWDPEEHEVARWCRLVTHYGCAARDTDLFLREPAEGREGILVHPGAADPDRRWPADRFAAVARGLATRGHRVRITAGPGEDELALGVVRTVAHPRVTLVAGLELVALAELVWRSRLVICGDTGVAHLATAVCTPSIIIFGPQPPARWGPPPLPRHRVFWRPGGDTVAGSGAHPALLRVQPTEVLAAAEELV